MCVWVRGAESNAQQACAHPTYCGSCRRSRPARVFGWNWIHVWSLQAVALHTISFPQSHASSRHPRTSRHPPTRTSGVTHRPRQRGTREAGLSIDSSFNMSTFPELSQQTTAKLVLLGEMGSGKSSLVLRYVKGQFFDYQVRHETWVGAWRGRGSGLSAAGRLLLMRSRSRCSRCCLSVHTHRPQQWELPSSPRPFQNSVSSLKSGEAAVGRGLPRGCLQKTGRAVGGAYRLG